MEEGRSSGRIDRKMDFMVAFMVLALLFHSYVCCDQLFVSKLDKVHTQLAYEWPFSNLNLSIWELVHNIV